MIFIKFNKMECIMVEDTAPTVEKDSALNALNALNVLNALS